MQLLRIRYLREKAQLQQKELAKRMGVSCATVCDWEAGKAFPMVTRLPRLAHVLGCSIAELFIPDSIIPEKEG